MCPSDDSENLSSPGVHLSRSVVGQPFGGIPAGALRAVVTPETATTLQIDTTVTNLSAAGSTGVNTALTECAGLDTVPTFTTATGSRKSEETRTNQGSLLVLNKSIEKSCTVSIQE